MPETGDAPRRPTAVRSAVPATFSRYKEDGTRYATHQALWVVTKLDGHWGIQCRSSFAP